MPRKKLLIFVIVFGLVAKYLQEAHGVDFYIREIKTTEEFILWGAVGVGGIIAMLIFIAKILGFGEGQEKSNDGWYHDDEEYAEAYQEDEEEIYEQPTRITWMNDYYD